MHTSYIHTDGHIYMRQKLNAGRNHRMGATAGLSLVLKVSGVGFITWVTSSLLNEAGKATASQFTSFAGIVVCCTIVFSEVGVMIREVESIFF
jgi:hypothetical protein